MDYNAYDWEAIEPVKSFRSLFVKTSLISVPVFFVVLGVLYLLATLQDAIRPLNLFIFMVIPASIIFIVLEIMIISLSRKSSRPFHKYSIGESGITTDGEVIKIEALNATAVKKMIESESLPYEQWSQTSIEDQTYELALSSRSGTVKLFFNQEYDRQRFLRSLSEHLSD